MSSFCATRFLLLFLAYIVEHMAYNVPCVNEPLNNFQSKLAGATLSEVLKSKVSIEREKANNLKPHQYSISYDMKHGLSKLAIE